VVSEYGRPGPIALHGHAHRPVVRVHVHLFHAGVAPGERPDGRQRRTDAGQFHFLQSLGPHAAAIDVEKNERRDLVRRFSPSRQVFLQKKMFSPDTRQNDPQGFDETFTRVEISKDFGKYPYAFCTVGGRTILRNVVVREIAVSTSVFH